MAGNIIGAKTIIYAILGGVVPAIFWLWFWLHEEDKKNPEPIGLIILTFFIGALSVILAIGLEKLTQEIFENQSLKIILWASIEELVKFLAVLIIINRNTDVDEPIDYPMYFIACALGFAALENVLFLIEPLSASGTVVGALTGNLRFLGSTLLHAIASGMIGSALGLSFYRGWFARKTYLLIGIISAIALHSLFNFFIMKGSGENFLQVFGFLWVVAIINILIFEKLKRMGGEKV
ncbi:PrsW family intramembrane metalloprotease [Candidatus Nomurabacteria bacterium]|nr:PrsW family intramembrane metalloprotease [Candidatus Nomurabacteria bacterium]